MGASEREEAIQTVTEGDGGHDLQPSGEECREPEEAEGEQHSVCDREEDEPTEQRQEVAEEMHSSHVEDEQQQDIDVLQHLRTHRERWRVT